MPKVAVVAVLLPPFSPLLVLSASKRLEVVHTCCHRCKVCPNERQLRWLLFTSIQWVATLTTVLTTLMLSMKPSAACLVCWLHVCATVGQVHQNQAPMQVRQQWQVGRQRVLMR